MRISTSLLAGTLAGLFALGGCAGTGPAKPPSVDTLMRDYSGDVPGAVVLVLRDGQPLVRRGYGLADMDAGTPATPQTNFRLASVSKQFTARSEAHTSELQSLMRISYAVFCLKKTKTTIHTTARTLMTA